MSLLVETHFEGTSSTHLHFSGVQDLFDIAEDTFTFEYAQPNSPFGVNADLDIIRALFNLAEEDNDSFEGVKQVKNVEETPNNKEVVSLSVEELLLVAEPLESSTDPTCDLVSLFAEPLESTETKTGENKEEEEEEVEDEEEWLGDDPVDEDYDDEGELFEEEEGWNRQNYNTKKDVMALRSKKDNKKEKISKRFVNSCRLAHEEALKKIHNSEIDARQSNSRVRVAKEISKRFYANQLVTAQLASLLSYKRNLQNGIANAAEVTLTPQQIQELQNRELTPEDYELLLFLDASVPKKTVSTSLIDKWETIVLQESNGEVCCICLSEYATRDTLKVLPCGHKFHKNCIETWLTTASVNCPADGLPLID